MVLPMTFENLVSTVVGLEGFVSTKTLLKKKKESENSRYRVELFCVLWTF